MAAEPSIHLLLRCRGKVAAPLSHETSTSVRTPTAGQLHRDRRILYRNRVASNRQSQLVSMMEQELYRKQAVQRMRTLHFLNNLKRKQSLYNILFSEKESHDLTDWEKSIDGSFSGTRVHYTLSNADTVGDHSALSIRTKSLSVCSRSPMTPPPHPAKVNRDYHDNEVSNATSSASADSQPMPRTRSVLPSSASTRHSLRASKKMSGTVTAVDSHTTYSNNTPTLSCGDKHETLAQWKPVAPHQMKSAGHFRPSRQLASNSCVDPSLLCDRPNRNILDILTKRATDRVETAQRLAGQAETRRLYQLQQQTYDAHLSTRIESFLKGLTTLPQE